MNHNDITGDRIKTKPASKEYRDNWPKIFKARKPKVEQQSDLDELKEYLTSQPRSELYGQ